MKTILVELKDKEYDQFTARKAGRPWKTILAIGLGLSSGASGNAMPDYLTKEEVAEMISNALQEFKTQLEARLERS